LKALVVIPTYNEAETILKVVGQVLAIEPRADVLVVDDGSPDGTAGLVEAQQGSEPRLHLLRRATKDGLGAAYRAGFAWGLARDYDTLVEMDADLSHPPDRLPALLDALARADLVIGSRYVLGGATRNWSRMRETISRGGNLYVQALLGLPVKDAPPGSAPTAGRCWRRSTSPRCARAATASRSRWPTAPGRRASRWSRSRSSSPSGRRARPR
jgi:dolichol-phosphate mannosyltransferase